MRQREGQLAAIDAARRAAEQAEAARKAAEQIKQAEQARHIQEQIEAARRAAQPPVQPPIPVRLP